MLVRLNNSNTKLFDEELEKPDYGNAGKYLLFSNNKQDLTSFVDKLVQSIQFGSYYISDDASSTDEFAFVAKLYYHENNSDIYNFIRSITPFNILFRGFKSEYKTSQGLYSIQYLTKSNLIPINI